MPSVFLGKPTVEYLKTHSNGQSMDATVRRLLKLDEGANGLVRRQIPREKLADFYAYTWTILNQLRTYDQANPQMARSELQKKVGETLEVGDLFIMFPDDATLGKRNQPRWKARFTNALAYLKKTGCVDVIGKDATGRTLPHIGKEEYRIMTSQLQHAVVGKQRGEGCSRATLRP